MLLIAKSSADWSDIPLGGTSIIKSVIELPVSFASITPFFTSVLVPLLIMTIVGGNVYPDPPEVIVTIPIVFESFKIIFGDIKTFGFKVLSEEYSNFSLIDLVSLTKPILLDFKETDKFLPFIVLTFESEGNFLYWDPPDISLTLFTGPDADIEVVVYSKLSHSEEVYVNFSGDFCKEIWKVVDPIPKTL